MKLKQLTGIVIAKAKRAEIAIRGLPRPGTIRRQLKNLAGRHWNARMLMSTVNEVFGWDSPVERPTNESLLPHPVLKALKNMVEYLWSEELPNYYTSNTEERSRHILKSVAVVNDWLNDETENPTDVDSMVDADFD